MNLPSDFAGIEPIGSIARNMESEVVAQNIMTILKRTGNTWRKLSWDEYKEERLKDGNFTGSERSYFDRVIQYCGSAEQALNLVLGGDPRISIIVAKP